jgi:uncharacterized membrane-anchored protein YhcB (DUF1043 family)
MLIECNAAQQTLIFIIGMMAGLGLGVVMAWFFNEGDKEQNKLTHKTHESDYESRD